MTAINTIADVEALDRAAERFETPCGVGHMVWRCWGDPKAENPLILAHGGSGSWTHWCRTVPALLDAGHTVYAVDLPGLGDSAMPIDPTHPACAAEAYAQGLRRLVPKEKGPRSVAFSFGCHVSTLAIAGLGDYVRDLVVIGTAALGTNRPRMEFPKERPDMTEAERRDVHRGVLELLMISRPERIDDLAIDLQARNVANARFRSRIHANTENVKRGLARIKQPLRTIWGEKDVVGYPDIPTVLTILGEHHPEMQSAIIPDAGHWVMYERADAFNEALVGMLA